MFFPLLRCKKRKTPGHTVDGSEIPNNHRNWIYKNLVNNGIFSIWTGFFRISPESSINSMKHFTCLLISSDFSESSSHPTVSTGLPWTKEKDRTSRAQALWILGSIPTLQDTHTQTLGWYTVFTYKFTIIYYKNATNVGKYYALVSYILGYRVNLIYMIPEKKHKMKQM